MILELKEFFFAIKDEVYCVIKPDDNLPKYLKGSDIDIFCYDSNTLAKKILAVGNKYIETGFEIFISNNNSQLYIDFRYKETNEIELRFDIYSSLPIYQNILIKPSYFESVLESRILFNTSNNFSFFVPCLTDDNILRYIEYQEWYGRRPDKIKHIDYILKSTDKLDKNKFLQKLHHYTEIPKVESVYPIRKDRKRYLKTSIKFLKISIKKIITKILPNKIKIFIKGLM